MSFKVKICLAGLLLLGGYFIGKSDAQRQSNAQEEVKEDIIVKSESQKEYAQINWASPECPKQQGKCPQSYQGKPPPLLLISLDGFHPSYLKRGYSPALNKIARCGTHTDHMYPAFPSKTFPNHFSIVTGLNPESHGIVDNNMYDPKTRRLFKFKNPDSNDPMWYLKEPIWVTAIQQGKKTASYFWPGSDVPIGGVLPTYNKKYSSRISYSQRVDQILDWLLMPANTRPSFLTLYVNQPDNAGHANGINSQQVNQAVQGVDQMIERLFAGLVSKNLLNCVNVIILSDHGMTNTDCKLVVDIKKYINVNNIFSTMGPFGRIRPKGRKDEAAINDLIEHLRCQSPSMRVYAKEQLPVRMHYANSDRIEPIFLDLDNRWTVVTKGVQPGDSICSNGAHGYDNLFPDMNAIFMAHGPSIKTNNAIKPFIATELYELMTELIGIVPNPNNGTRGSLHNVLRAPKRLPSQVEPDPPITSFVPSDPREYKRRVDAADCTCQDPPEQVDTTEIESKKQLHLPFGGPHDTQDNRTIQLLYNEDYISAYNLKYKMPAWISFTISGKKDVSKLDEKCFIGDARIPASDMAKCSHYELEREKAIFQRPLYYPGFSDVETTPEALLVSNLIPKSLNHTNILEGKMNQILANRAQEKGHLNVVMGPAFDLWANGLKPSFGKILKLKDKYRSVLVPTHVFVIASWCSQSVDSLSSCSPSKIESTGYLLPNEPFTKNCASGESVIAKNGARIVDIENLTGISFFTGLPIYDAIRLRTAMPPSIA